MKASQIFVGEIAEQISLPEVYSEVRQLIEYQESSIQDFVDIIEHDKMLSLRLMRIANSVYFGFPSRAKDLYQTISLIGIMQLHDLILNCLCLRTFTGIPTQIFDMRSFWRYSIDCAIASRTIAQHGQIFPINPFFTLGLLHEIGHAVMYVREPELSSQAIDEAAQSDTPLVDKERELFGFDYTEIGMIVMQTWQLPSRFHRVNAQHLHPEQVDEAHRQAVNIVSLAHQVCENPVPGGNQDAIAKAKSVDPELNKLPDNINDIILKEIQANRDEVLSMLWPLRTQDITEQNAWLAQ